MVKFGIEFVPGDLYWRTTYYSIQAEKLGLDQIWITDHFNNRNVYVTLSVISAYTDRIGIGPGVTNPYLIHPVMTAQAVASLNEVAPGRVSCGLGAGDKTTLDMVGAEWSKPLTAVRETVEIIRALTSTEGIEFKGKLFSITKGARFNFRVRNPIPIYVGAQGPKMLGLAAQIGDGVLINASHPKDIERAMKHIAEGAEKAHKALVSLDIAAYTCFSVAKEEKKAVKAAVPVVAFIAAGCPKAILRQHGIPSEKADSIRSAIVQGRFPDAFSAVTQEMINAFSVCGTPDTCVEKIDELLKIGVTQFVSGSPIGPRIRRSLDLFGSEVIPHFKED